MKKRSLVLLLCGLFVLIMGTGAILLYRSIVSTPLHTQCEAIRPLIAYNGIDYSPATTIESSHQLTSADLGPIVGTAVSGSHTVQYTCDLLSPGQQVYRIRGYKDAFRLAAQGQHGIYFFEVSNNPHAMTGADLFDIDGKVQFITVAPLDNPERPSKTVRDPRSIQLLTQMILEAPVARQCSYSQNDEALLFHLKDGSIVQTTYMPTSQALSTSWPQCVSLPRGFAATLTMLANSDAVMLPSSPRITGGSPSLPIVIVLCQTSEPL